MEPKDGTVGALIEALKQFPADARVEIVTYEEDPHGGFGYPDMADEVTEVDWHTYTTGLLRPTPTENVVVGLFSR